MAYASYDELKSAYGETRVFQAFAESTQETPQPYFERKLEGAAGLMDSYIGRVYTVPVDTTGNARLAALLSSINICVALFQMTTGTVALPESIHTRYKSCMEWLRMVADGDVVLPGGVIDYEIFGVVGDAVPLIESEIFENDRLIDIGTCAS